MGKKSRLTGTAKLIIVVGVITLVLGGIFSIPSLGASDQPDVSIIKDQFNIAENFVPFRTAGAQRTTTTSGGETVESTADFTNAIDSLTAQQVSEIIKELPQNCGVKLFTTIVTEDGSKLRFSSGVTSFAPVQTLNLITEQGQPINRFETIPLLTCDVILSKNDERLGYIHQWLQGVNVNWEFVKADGTKDSVNTASQGAGGTSTAPKCTPVLFDDVGDLASAGYTTSQINEYKNTFGFDQTSIFIGSERALCAKDANGVVAEPFVVTADEIESRLGSDADFDTTLNIRITSGTLILEVPFISEALGEPFISRQGIDQFLSRQVLSYTVDFEEEEDPTDVEPAPSGVTRTITLDSFDPVKIDVANLEDEERTVTMRIKLNSYDISEGTPKMVIKKDSIITGTAFAPVTATITMKDAGISGLTRIFEGKWVVPTGQSLGTYQMKVSMDSRTNDLAKLVEIVQKAEDAPSTSADNGCSSGQQQVSDENGNQICVAECADNLIWDVIQQACAQKASCAEGLEFEINDQGKKVCVDKSSTSTNGMCRDGLNFNSQTERCEQSTTTTIPKCKAGESLVNTGGTTQSCTKLPDFGKLLTPIACTDKIGFTEQGFCLPPFLVGLFQNPIQLLFIGVGAIIFIVIIKFLINSINRSRGGLVLNK